MNASSNYKAYLLRLWLAGDGDQPEWRASLEDPGTGEVRGFSDLDEMVEFLKNVEQEGKTIGTRMNAEYADKTI
ncbi:MAG: hypothetical protein EHM37_23555 [Deltaproteobacteria bacterium]|nr:MAG: hypothetical protein EHM37_23555 [Deltaproteobacteria bacterium]